MKLTRIDVTGFGCLRDFRAELAPGLNVFYGMNEAGKSTLQHAVRALLYGFYDGDRARPDETARHERFRPWEGGLYRGSLEYEMEDGRRFEVRRDFSTGDLPTQLIDLFTGQDVSPAFGRGRHGNVPFARRHLGMSRTVFESCAFISQGEIFHVADNGPKEIADAIAALADSAGRDVSATKAIERLRSALSRVGSDRARTAELPKAREALATAERELREIDETRRLLAQKAAALDSIEDDLRAMERRLAEAEREFAIARSAELRGRLRAIDESQTALDEAIATMRQLQPHARFAAEIRDDVLSQRAMAERAAESLASARSALGEAESGITSEERLEFEALRAAVGAMESGRIAALEQVAYGPVRPWIGRVLAAIGSAIARAARAVWRFVRRLPPPEMAAGAEPLDVSREEAVSLLERHRRYLTLVPAIDRLRELAARVDAAESDLQSAQARLGALLRSADIEAGGGLADGVIEFLERCKLRARYERAAAEADEAQKRIDLLLSGGTRDALQEEISEYARRVDALPGTAGARPGGASKDVARVLQSLREEKSQLELKAEGLRREVQITMSRHRSRAEVEEEIALARRRVGELERAREALRIAAEGIEEAMLSVYRDFAPAVNTFLSDGIERVTAGRYSRAHVDPKTLGISLLVPETGMVVEDPPVSHGTRTLAYVLMRIGLAQHMSSVGEPVPLVLDDPFVDVDTERLPRILDYLAELSGRVQVLIFTKDEAIAGWCRSRVSEGHHRIHSLSISQPAAHTL